MLISVFGYGSITAAILFFIFCHYNRIFLRPRRLERSAVDNRAQVRRHTNEMEQFLIDDGCMSDLFTLTTWDESTVIETPPEPKPRGGLSYVSPTYPRMSREILSAHEIHSMSMQQYAERRNELLRLQSFFSEPSVYVSPTQEVFGAKTKHCRWCHRGTQRTKGGLCMTCWDAGIR